MLTEQEPLTSDEIAARLDIKKSTFFAAIADLGISAERPIRGDRRLLVYPADTVERVRQWLVNHRQ